MRIKTLYLSLSALALITLTGGIAYIWLDGKQGLKKDQLLSRSKLNETIGFFELIGSIEKYLDQALEDEQSAASKKNRKELLRKLEDIYGSTQNLSEQRKIERIIDTIHEKRKSVLIQKNGQEKLILSIKGLWQRIENNVTSEVRDLMAKEQELAPTLNKTLGEWSNTFPFLKEIQKKMDLTYLEKKDVSELKEMLSFSQYLSQVNQREVKDQASLKNLKKETKKRLKNLPETTSTTSKKGRKLLSTLLDKYFSLTERYIEQIKNQKQALENINGLKNRLRNEEQTTLIKEWQQDFILANQQKNLQMLKRHQLVLDALIFIAVITIIFSLIIFLKIFPNLKKLEEKANATAKGDFSQEFHSIPKNEIGAVMEAFNHMTRQLQLYLKKIKDEQEQKNKLSQSVQEMRHLSEMGEAAAKMAHELKNPLSILNFCLKDIQRTISSSLKTNTKNLLALELKADMEKSLSALKRLQQATQNLDSKRITSPPEVVDLNKLLVESLDFYSSRFKDEGIQVSHELEQSGTLKILAPPLEFMGALTNLIDNALEYFSQNTKVNKLIDIKTELRGEEVTLHVASAGEPLDEGDKVFHNFYSTKTGPLRGLGLGVVKDVVEKSKGKISYTHQNGMNTFTLIFPQEKV